MQRQLSTSSKGFTLIEILVVAPIAILAIGAFIAIIVNVIGDVLVTRDASAQIYNTNNTLQQIEQDIRLGVEFPATTGPLPSPQGSNNNFTGTAAFNSSDENTLIINTAATNRNPGAEPLGAIIYYANQPNTCTSSNFSNNPDVIFNRIFYNTNIYFIKDGSLWRRTFVPDHNFNLGNPDANTICAHYVNGPWQRNTCSPASTATRCETKDTKLLDNVTDFSVEYFATPDSTTDIGPGAAQSARAINVSITSESKIAGESTTVTRDRRMTKLNLVQPVEWSPINLQAGWSRFSVEYGEPSYTITSAGVVYLRGLITGGTTTNGTIIGTLPPGYRPSEQIVFPTSSSGDKAGRIDVREDGTIRFVAGENGWTSLDNIHFLANNAPYSFTNLSFQNGWTNYSASTRPLQVGVDGAGRTHLRGLVKPGDSSVNTTIASIPTSMQPENKYNYYSGVTSGATEYFGYYGIISGHGLRYRYPANASWLAIHSIFYPGSFTGWSDLSLDPAWSVYGGIYPEPKFTKATDGVVTVKGLVRGGSNAANTVIATLPPGYRPGSVRSFNLVGNSASHARINVYPTGEIRVRYLESSSWLSLGGISFIAGY